jgi:hypothetical protein
MHKGACGVAPDKPGVPSDFSVWTTTCADASVEIMAARKREAMPSLWPAFMNDVFLPEPHANRERFHIAAVTSSPVGKHIYGEVGEDSKCSIGGRHSIIG